MSNNQNIETELPVVKDVQECGAYVGYCKWFNNKLGYGFIKICTSDLNGHDLFIHHSGLKPLNSSFKTLYKGEYVNFDIIDGRNGKQAVNVTGIHGGPLMCDNISFNYFGYKKPYVLPTSLYYKRRAQPKPPGF